MTGMKNIAAAHPTERELSDYLDHVATGEAKKRVEEHVASCSECLTVMVSAYDSVKSFKKRKDDPMKKLSIYLILAILSFLLSFAVPQYFAQFLVAAALLGIKWISDAKTTRMLVMIYDAWKNGSKEDVSRVINTLDAGQKTRF